MSGNVSFNGVVLGASTTVGGAIALLPNTGQNRILRYFLISILVVATAVLITRATKLVVAKVNK